MTAHQTQADPLVAAIDETPAASAARAFVQSGLTLLSGLRARPGFRYLCVGAICASTNWAVMLLIDKERYLLSSIICFLPLATLGFLLHAALTFRVRPSVRSWLAYLVGLLPGSTLSLGILAVFRDGLDLPLFIAIPVTVATMTIFNYLVACLAIVGLAPRGFDGRAQ